MKTNTKITQKNIDYFFRDLWKDGRKIEKCNNESVDVIRRYSDGCTSIEEEVIFFFFLKKLNLNIKYSDLRNVNSEYLEFNYFPGIRVFNFFMELKSLYFLEKQTEAHRIATETLNQLNRDLVEFQSKTNTLAIEAEYYPFFEKTWELIEFLASIFSISLNRKEVESDLKIIAEIMRENSDVLFRDMSTKNCLLNIPDLCKSKYGSKKERTQKIRDLLKQKFFTKERIETSLVHFDFSGCKFSCTSCDDYIALNMHEGSNWINSEMANKWDKKIWFSTLFIRHLRFGGRKLAYRFINQKGYKVRFNFDNEIIYFVELEKITLKLKELDLIKGNSIINFMRKMQMVSTISPEVDLLSNFIDTSKVNYYEDVFPY